SIQTIPALRSSREPATPGQAPPQPDANTQADSSSGSAQRTAGFVIAGVGAAGLVAWGITGAISMAKLSDVKNADPGCPDHCRATTDQGAYPGLRTASMVAFYAGLGGVALGTVLLLSAPRASKTTARITPVIGFGSASLQGRF